MLLRSMSGRFPCLKSQLTGNCKCELTSCETGTVVDVSTATLISSSFADFRRSNSSLIFLHYLHLRF